MAYLDIERLLMEQNKSKYQLVEALDSNYTIVNNMINRKTASIYMKTIDKLCDFFECEPGDLIKRDTP